MAKISNGIYPTEMIQRNEVAAFRKELGKARSVVLVELVDIVERIQIMTQSIIHLQLSEYASVRAIQMDLDGMFSELNKKIRELNAKDFVKFAKFGLHEMYGIEYDRYINKKYIDEVIYDFDMHVRDMIISLSGVAMQEYLNTSKYLGRCSIRIEETRKQRWTKKPKKVNWEKILNK